MSEQKTIGTRWRSWDGRIVQVIERTKYWGWLVEEVEGPEVGRRYAQSLHKSTTGIGGYTPCR